MMVRCVRMWIIVAPAAVSPRKNDVSPRFVSERTRSVSAMARIM